MKTIEIRAAGTPSISGTVKKTVERIASMRVTIAAIGAAVCYAGTAAGSDPLMYAGAFAALCAVRTLAGTTPEKGGER
jgi:hypothetical protein